MEFGTHINQGEIWLVPYPYSDLSGFKKRPVLVLSKLNYNKIQNDILVCQISSVVKNKSYSKFLCTQSLSNGIIKKESEIRFYNLTILNKDILIHKIGILKKEELKNSLNILNDFLQDIIF